MKKEIAKFYLCMNRMFHKEMLHEELVHESFPYFSLKRDYTYLRNGIRDSTVNFAILDKKKT